MVVQFNIMTKQFTQNITASYIYISPRCIYLAPSPVPTTTSQPTPNPPLSLPSPDSWHHWSSAVVFCVHVMKNHVPCFLFQVSTASFSLPFVFLWFLEVQLQFVHPQSYAVLYWEAQMLVRQQVLRFFRRAFLKQKTNWSKWPIRVLCFFVK